MATTNIINVKILPSGPKPSVRLFSVMEKSNKAIFAALPLTGRPKILPCVKFHIVWIAATIQMFLRIKNISDSSTLNNIRFTIDNMVTFALPQCMMPKTKEL